MPSSPSSPRRSVRGSGPAHRLGHRAARSAVTYRVRAAVKRIAEVHPELGRHLGNSIRTGRVRLPTETEVVGSSPGLTGPPRYRRPTGPRGAAACTVKAVRVVRNGRPTEAIEVLDVPVPEPEPGEVRIAVSAASLNFGDIARSRGGVASVMAEPPFTLGMDVCGVVDAAGEPAPRSGSAGGSSR